MTVYLTKKWNAAVNFIISIQNWKSSYIQDKFYLVVVGLRVVEKPGGRIPGLLGGAGGWGRGGRSDIWEVVGGPTGGLVGLKKYD